MGCSGLSRRLYVAWNSQQMSRRISWFWHRNVGLSCLFFLASDWERLCEWYFWETLLQTCVSLFVSRRYAFTFELHLVLSTSRKEHCRSRPIFIFMDDEWSVWSEMLPAKTKFQRNSVLSQSLIQATFCTEFVWFRANSVVHFELSSDSEEYRIYSLNFALIRRNSEITSQLVLKSFWISTKT